MSKLDPQNWVTSGVGWTPSPSRFQWEGLNISGNNQETNIRAKKKKAVHLCGAARKGFVHPLPMEGLWAQTHSVPVPSSPSSSVLGCCQAALTTLSEMISGLPGGPAAGIIFDTPRVAEPPVLLGTPSPLADTSQLPRAQLSLFF